MGRRVDVVVVGGGIAGMSVAGELAADLEVVLIERETEFMRHSTGRSAAVFVPGLGGPAFSALAEASRAVLEAGDEEFGDGPLLSQTGLLTLHVDDRAVEVDVGNHRSGATEEMSPDEIASLVSWVDTSLVRRGEYQRDVADLDVAGLHQLYVRKARSRGVELVRDAEVRSISRSGSGWTVTAGDDDWSCSSVVNAAGAWGDQLAALAGVQPVGLIPKRRTAFTVGASGVSVGGPMIADATMSFYARPEAGEQLLMSPMDQVPTEPCDVRHDEIDVAMAIDRGQPFIRPQLRHVRTAWAGLRVFAPDEHPVIGASGSPGFFWLCGQGGTGIQTAPGAARCAAALVVGDPIPSDIIDAGLDPTLIDPLRFA